ncbi:MAG: hypothetical protein CJBNEKGG_00163 [Prosthecobacter sp.]|nr:hypothetical protein [Prosthecobacter sp.]
MPSLVHDPGPVRFLSHLILMTALSALSGAAWVAHRPAPIPSLPEARPEGRQRDLVDDLKQASIKGAGILEVSQAEINRHLARVLTARTDESLGSRVKLEAVRVELLEDLAKVTVVWNVLGHRSTVTLDLAVNRLEKVFRIEVVGGAYGHLPVPRGMLRPLAPVLRGLGEALRPEIQALFQMNQVTIAPGKLLLDPRFP